MSLDYKLFRASFEFISVRTVIFSNHSPHGAYNFINRQAMTLTLTDKSMQAQAHRHLDRQAHRHLDIQAHRHLDRQAHRHLDIQVHRHLDRQAHRQLERQPHGLATSSRTTSTRTTKRNSNLLHHSFFPSFRDLRK